MSRDTTKLTPLELTTFLEHHTEWNAEGKSGEQLLSRTFEFPKFADGIRFVNRLAEAADAANHHPDIDIRYTKIRIALTTHDAGGLTFRDRELAEKADVLFKAL